MIESQRISDLKNSQQIINLVLERKEKSNYVEILYLIELGEDINQRDENGMTPLILCCKLGYYKCLTLLINLGADIEDHDIDFKTPIEYAVEGNHKKIIDLLCTNKNQSIVSLKFQKPLYFTLALRKNYYIYMFLK